MKEIAADKVNNNPILIQQVFSVDAFEKKHTLIYQFHQMKKLKKWMTIQIQNSMIFEI